MQELSIKASDKTRRDLLKKGVWLEIATVAWNLFEATIAISFGMATCSIALLGFGFDSLIETASAATVGWRLQAELKGASIEFVEKAETFTSKIAGGLLFVLAAYVLFDSTRQLLGYGDHAKESWIGVMVTVAALIVMPCLAAAKLKIAGGLNSKALRADAMESSCCAWFAFATLVGLVLNTTLHWWWADSVAGLVLVPLIVREAYEAIKNEDCGCHVSCDNS